MMMIYNVCVCVRKHMVIGVRALHSRSLGFWFKSWVVLCILKWLLATLCRMVLSISEISLSQIVCLLVTILSDCWPKWVPIPLNGSCFCILQAVQKSQTSLVRVTSLVAKPPNLCTGLYITSSALSDLSDIAYMLYPNFVSSWWGAQFSGEMEVARG